jgi:hypothetical protein
LFSKELDAKAGLPEVPGTGKISRVEKILQGEGGRANRPQIPHEPAYAPAFGSSLFDIWALPETDPPPRNSNCPPHIHKPVSQAALLGVKSFLTPENGARLQKDSGIL